MRILLILLVGAAVTGCSTVPNFNEYKHNDRNLIKQQSNVGYLTLRRA
jgi:hypothetical protein